MLHEARLHPAGARTEVAITYPAGEPLGGAILFPPHPLLGGDMDNNVVVALARALPAAGLAAFRFNYRGAGAADLAVAGRARYDYWRRVEERGDYAAVVEDARAACAWARGLFEPAALVGYSFGAAVAARLAAEDRVAEPLVLICPPFRRLDLESLAGRAAPTLLVIAGADPLGGAPGVDELRERLPAARVELVEGEGHFFIGAEADLVERVLGFLRAPDGGRTTCPRT